MFGFNEKVGGNTDGVGSVVGNEQAFGGAKQHHGGNSVALHFHLGTGNGRATGANNFAHWRNALGAKTECSNSGRPVGAIHASDAKESTHHKHCGVNCTIGPWCWRHEKCDVFYSGDNGRNT